MPQSDQCIKCKHYRGLISCDAFPDKIPEEIYSGFHDHTEPYPGDKGIVYEKLALTKAKQS